MACVVIRKYLTIMLVLVLESKANDSILRLMI